jgi:diguanylate cyclase (GGDEF)-like protein
LSDPVAGAAIESGVRGTPTRLLTNAAERLLIAANEGSDVLSVATDLLGEGFGYGMRYILRYEPARDELVMARAAGPTSDRPEVRDFRVANGVGITGTCAATRRVVNVADARADPRYLSVVTECASEICVPLDAGDELLGVMSVQSNKVAAFGPEDEETLVAFAKLVALALLHARALRARRADIAALRAQANVASVASGLDLERTLRETVDIVRRATDSDSAVLYLTDEESDDLYAGAASIDERTYPSDYLERLRERRTVLGESMSGWVADRREALKIDDLARDPRPLSVRDLPLVPKSAIAVPLLAEDRLYGVLRTTKLGIASYTDEQFALMRGVASQVALAIAAAKAHEQVRRLSVTDELTGLHNARYFRSRLAEEVTRAARYERELALLVIDCDGFKRVNDTLGHLAGDRVLADLARSIRASIRATDIAARYGGDEFVVLQPETRVNDATLTAQRIRDAARAVIEGVEVSVSIGLACYPSDAADAEALFSAADAALYEAKRRGKDAVVTREGAAT